MNWSVAVSVVIAAVGWVVVHYFTTRREAAVNRRAIVTGYLVDAYRRLNAFACVCASGGDWSEALVGDLNSAIADVQLFGSAEQIQLALTFVTDLLETRCVPGEPLTKLLQNLRRDLRSELDLGAVDTPIAHFRAGFAGTGGDDTEQPNKTAPGAAAKPRA